MKRILLTRDYSLIHKEDFLTVAITGRDTRKFLYAVIAYRLDDIESCYGIKQLILTDVTDAEVQALRWAKINKKPFEYFRADWLGHGEVAATKAYRKLLREQIDLIVGYEISKKSLLCRLASRKRIPSFFTKPLTTILGSDIEPLLN